MLHNAVPANFITKSISAIYKQSITFNLISSATALPLSREGNDFTSCFLIDEILSTFNICMVY